MQRTTVNYQGTILDVEYYAEYYQQGKGNVIENIYNELGKSVMDDYTDTEHDYILDLVEDELSNEREYYLAEKKERLQDEAKEAWGRG